MPTLEELSQWSNEHIRAEIVEKLPQGWVFEHKFDPSVGWCAYIRDESEAVVWNHIGEADPKLTLFGAYGWLSFRDQKAKHPAWSRSRDIPAPRSGRMTIPGVEETPLPEDLSPEFINSVYFDSGPKRR